MSVGAPAAAAARASVPMTSSASTPVDAQQRNAHGFDRFEQRPDLRAQLVGHRRPVGFVLGVQLAAERLAGSVEHDGHARRLPLVEQLVEHVDDAEHGVRRLAACRRQRRNRVKRAVEIRRAVDENERASAHPRSSSVCSGSPAGVDAFDRVAPRRAERAALAGRNPRQPLPSSAARSATRRRAVMTRLCA